MSEEEGSYWLTSIDNITDYYSWISNVDDDERVNEFLDTKLQYYQSDKLILMLIELFKLLDEELLSNNQAKEWLTGNKQIIDDHDMVTGGYDNLIEFINEKYIYY